MASTTTTTTTLPPDVHPVFRVAWADVLPDPDTRAVYRIDLAVSETPMNHDLGVQGDLEARMEYGVEWFGRDGTFDRFVLGLENPSSPGMALYFRLDEPWVVEFSGLEVWPDGDTGRGPEILVTFAEPASFDLSGGPGETGELQGIVTAIGPWGLDELEANVDVTLSDTDAGPVTVAASTFEQAVVYEALLYGPIVGGPDFPIVSRSAPTNCCCKRRCRVLRWSYSSPGASPTAPPTGATQRPSTAPER